MVYPLLERLKSETIVLADGAWGTQLIQRGLDVNQEPADVWNLRRAEVVAEIAGAYGAHADILTTNTFGANRVRLERFGLGAQLHAINLRGVALARAAERARGIENRPMLIAGAMGPMRGPDQRTPDDGALFDAYQEQSACLAAAGADFILLETMTDLAEACIAVRAVKAVCALEIVCAFAFRAIEPGRFVTWSGEGVETALGTAMESGATITGTNCVPATASILPLIGSMRQFSGAAPLWFKPNAGEPHGEGRDLTYPSPFPRAPLGPMLDALGTGVMGGCCGTTPEDIAVLRRALDQHTG